MQPPSIDPAAVRAQPFWHDPRPLMISPGGFTTTSGIDVPDDHLLFATSGTSGKSKWISLSKDALLCSARAVNQHLEVTSKSVWGLALPIHHVGGFGVVARSYEINCDLQVFTGPWNPGRFTEWLAQGNVTHVSLVPTQVHDLVHAGCRSPRSLVAAVVGGGKLDSVLERAARDSGWPVLVSYGLTEAASQVATQRPGCGGCGDEALVVLPHWQARADAEGCLEIRGPALFSGVVVDGSYVPRRGEWHATRDRMQWHAGGLVPVGRADSLVKVAGELLNPSDVEASLAAELGVHGTRIAVVPCEDARLGHRFGWVVEQGVPAESVARAMERYNHGVPRSQRVGPPVVVAALPRGELGKIRRADLSRMIAGSRSADRDQAGRSR